MRYVLRTLLRIRFSITPFAGLTDAHLAILDPPMGVMYLTNGVRCYEGQGENAALSAARHSYCWAVTDATGRRFGGSSADATRALLSKAVGSGAPLLCATDACNCVRFAAC